MNYNKELSFSNEARAKILSGVEKLSKAVKCTLGPCGRNVIIENMYGTPNITKDGVSVAKQIFFKDPYENIGANLVKEVASKTAVDAGDGTTTSTVLAESIYKNGLQTLNTGVNPNELKRGIDAAVNVIVNGLGKLKVEINGENYDQIKQIATISANGDEEIGTVIANAISKVGVNGTVTVSDSKSNKTFYDIIQGMEFSNGYASPFFVTNEDRGTVELEDCFILLYGKKIKTISELLPILQYVSQQKKSLLIIADDIETEVLATLVLNKTRGVLSVCVVKSPSFGDIRKDVMQDIAVLTNAQYISEELGMALENAQPSILGIAKHITVKNTSTTIIDGMGKKENIEKRISDISNRLSLSTHEGEKVVLKRRLSKMTDGVAMIYAGANTIIELSEKKDRIDDALHATIAALEEGIVPGGGTALIKASKLVKKDITSIQKGKSDAFKYGVQIVLDAIKEPLKQITANGGYASEVVLNKVESYTNNHCGFDALNNKYVNLVEAGIIDPVKVTRTALESAASVAGLLLTTECIVAIEQDETPTAPQMPMQYPPQM